MSGGVRLKAFKDLDAYIRLKSVSGSISSDFSVRIDLQKGNRLEGKIGEGSVPLDVNTVSGRIRIDSLD